MDGCGPRTHNSGDSIVANLHKICNYPYMLRGTNDGSTLLSPDSRLYILIVS